MGSRGPRRLWLAAALLAASSGSTDLAHGLGSMTAGDHVPLEQRVLIALGPDRTTLWSQLRVDTKPGPLAIVVPALPGAALDWSTPAWFEALEVATAPRILPPPGAQGTCPDEPAEDVFDLVGSTYHVDPLVPQELTVAADADGVVAWATAHNLVVSPPLLAGLGSLPGYRFVLARFDAPDGVVSTPTLRVVGPGMDPTVPLVVTAATSEPVLVTVWTLTAGRAELDGPAAVLVDEELIFHAATGESNYATLRATELSSPAGASLLEVASRTALADELLFGEASHVIEGVVTTYFKRAALYQAGAIDAATCTAQSEVALASPSPLGPSCPRADLGVVDGVDSCTEAVLPGQIDPELLRCGSLADDLAVALSGQPLDSAWLSRHALRIDTGMSGWVKAVANGTGPSVDPVWTAAELNESGCGGSGSGGGSSSSASGTTSSGTSSTSGGGGANTVQVPVYEVDTSCGAREIGDILYYVVVEASEEEPPPDYYYAEEDCSGDTSESYTPVYDDDWGGETETDGYEYEEDGADGYEGDDCGGDTSDTSGDSGDDCEGDTSDTGSSNDDCEGDTSDSGSSSDDCEGDTGDSSGDADCGSDTGSSSGDSGCSGGEGDSGCALSGKRRRRMPRLSILVVSAIALLAPLRRLTGPRRRRKRRGRHPRRR